MNSKNIINPKGLIKRLCKRWFIDAFSGMALGLFATLIAGTILKTIGQLIGDNYIGNIFVLTGQVASILMGAGIGAGIASHLKASNLVIFSTMVAGFIGAYSSNYLGASFAGGTILDITGILSKGLPGNPIGAYVVSIIVCEIGNLISGKTKLDILLIPLVSMFVSIIAAYIAFPFIWLINQLGLGIALATRITPFFMGIIIASVVGVLLTLPTSSAAIWVAVASPILSNAASSPENIDAILIAGGAAVVGCACQMVGFAVISYKENGVAGLISQGLGTSMLQIPNIMKNPKIFIPPIVASMICGPLATCLFKLKCGTGGGMGTCGFVGIIDSYKYSIMQGNMKWWVFLIAVVLLFFVLPAVVSWAMAKLLRKVNWIKEGDLKLDL